ncbi:MAG: 4Fe-4S binding protein [Coriobacteriales bacterium]|jgi:ferredoxin-type protein NapH|nr:4Fe-4S binding protein [Coriobacteriales bacterium]
MKVKHLRWLVLAAVFLVVAICLVLNTSIGTLSSLGWQAVATICPLGALESMLAAKSVFPRTLIILAGMVVFSLVLGKVFCAWLCPAQPVTRFFDRLFARLRTGGLPAKAGDEPACDSASDGDSNSVDACADEIAVQANDQRRTAKVAAPCTTCAEKRFQLDSRHLVLAGSLLSAAIFGFPVFCLICPIGLIFGTIIVVWQFIGFDDVSLSLLIYPLVLIVELVVLRKWCARFCPLGALLSLLSLPSRILRPQVDSQKCLRARGRDCQVCVEVCPEGLDPHYAQGMHDCSKCANCLSDCPSKAISIPLLKK